MRGLVHTLEVVGDVVSGVLDPDGEDRGHPGVTPTVLGTFAGNIQPKSARERASVAGTEAAVYSHRIYLEGAALELPVDEDMRVRKSGNPDPDLNGEYRLGFVGNSAGRGHHVECDAERLVP